MKKRFLLILMCAIVWSCSSNTHNKNKSEEEPAILIESSDKLEEVFSDSENSFKQWNADNPRRPDIDDRNIDAEPGPEYQKAYKERRKDPRYSPEQPPEPCDVDEEEYQEYRKSDCDKHILHS